MPAEPWVLGINTATETLAVALARGGKVHAEWWSDGAARQRHAEVLLVAMDALLKVADLGRADLGALAVAVGPGGFTGVRTALATAKAVALALDLPLLGVSTLDALALQAAAARVSPMIDARKGDVFAALYEEGRCIMGPELVSGAAWAARLTGPVVALGDGALEHAAALGAAGATLAPLDEQHRLRAGAVALLGARVLASGSWPAIDEVQAAYLRLPSAIAHWAGGPA